jgi:hypothetical protein
MALAELSITASVWSFVAAVILLVSLTWSPRDRTVHVALERTPSDNRGSFGTAAKQSRKRQQGNWRKRCNPMMIVQTLGAVGSVAYGIGWLLVWLWEAKMDSAEELTALCVGRGLATTCYFGAIGYLLLTWQESASLRPLAQNKVGCCTATVLATFMPPLLVTVVGTLLATSETGTVWPANSATIERVLVGGRIVPAMTALIISLSKGRTMARDLKQSPIERVRRAGQRVVSLSLLTEKTCTKSCDNRSKQSPDSSSLRWLCVCQPT